MGKIHKLSPILADMIAAGEVVERPASVVKELIENAIDAGAKKITVEIKNGGITFIRVSDDGCGMSSEDATTAFLRHATSKISSVEDLGGIATMGFRGEALAAISAVSKIDLLTRMESDELGTSVRVEAGNVLEVQPAGCPVGTTMIVRDLFYNTPARMKFLKRDSVEGSYLSGAVQRQALGHPEIAFRFIRDGKPELSTPGDGKLMSAIYAVMGRACAKEMVEVSSKTGGMTVTGFVGKPTASRGSRSYQHFFVNGRYVKSGMMASALEEAYKNQQMVGRFPICVLHLEMSPEAVDVNVHPAKTEVKFLRESDVFDTIHYGVLGALNRAPGRPEMNLGQSRSNPAPQVQPRKDFFKTVTAQEYRTMTELLDKSAKAKPESSFLSGIESARQTPKPEPVLRERVHQIPQPEKKSEPLSGIRTEDTDYGSFRIHSTPAEKPAAPKTQPVEIKPEAASAEPAPSPVEETVEPAQMSVQLPPMETPVFPEKEPAQTPKLETEAPYRIVGQALDTYIIVEQGDGLLLIDKHAAHERILFEKLRAEKHEIMSQVLLQPLTLTLSREEYGILLEQAELMDRMGFTIEDFGDGVLLVRAIPGDIDGADAEACLSELAQKLLEGQKLSPETVYDELLHTVACKAAIKGGQKSDPKELAALVAELMSRDDIKYCPHGRPVCIQLSRKTIERQFKRI